MDDAVTDQGIKDTRRQFHGTSRWNNNTMRQIEDMNRLDHTDQIRKHKKYYDSAERTDSTLKHNSDTLSQTTDTSWRTDGSWRLI